MTVTRPEELEGLVTTEICEVLRALAAEVDPELAIVEIGSYKGQSTTALASGALAGHGAHVWAVDPWDTPGNVTGRFGFADPATREAFEQQVEAAGLTDRITPVQGFSVEVAKGWDGPPIGLLYIDGDHSERAVREDFYAWRSHLALDAAVVFDDLDTPRNPGVRVVVDELVNAGYLMDFHVRADRLAVGRV